MKVIPGLIFGAIAVCLLSPASEAWPKNPFARSKDKPTMTADVDQTETGETPLQGETTPPPTPRLCVNLRKHGVLQTAITRASYTWDVPEHVQLALLHSLSPYFNRIAEAGPRTDYALRAWLSLSDLIYEPGIQLPPSMTDPASWERYKADSGRSRATPMMTTYSVDYLSWHIHVTSQVTGYARDDVVAQYVALRDGPRALRHAGPDASQAYETALQVKETAALFKEKLAACP